MSLPPDLRQKLRSVFSDCRQTFVVMSDAELQETYQPMGLEPHPRTMAEIKAQNEEVAKESRKVLRKSRTSRTRTVNSAIRAAGHDPEKFRWLSVMMHGRSKEEFERVLIEGRDLDRSEFKTWVKEAQLKGAQE